MATGTIKSNVITKGTITAVSGFSVNEAKCVQIGNVVWIKCYIQKSSGTISASGSTTHVATISGVDLPSQNLRFIAGCGSAAYEANKACYAIAALNGKIEVLPSTASPVVIINLTYLVGQTF